MKHARTCFVMGLCALLPGARKCAALDAGHLRKATPDFRDVERLGAGSSATDG